MTRQNTSPVEMASPGPSAAAYFHCIQRPELAWLPSFSTEAVTGSMKHSVFTFLGSRPGPFQKDAVSLSKMLTWTIQSRFCNAFRTLLEFGRLHAGFWPTQVRPLILPAYMASIMLMTEASCPSSSFGR